MRQIGAVIDYGASEVRVPLLNDVTKFPITVRPPARTTPGVEQHGHISRKLTFMALPQIEGLLKVMAAFNPYIPWLPHACQLAKNLNASAVTTIPPLV